MSNAMYRAASRGVISPHCQRMNRSGYFPGTLIEQKRAEPLKGDVTVFRDAASPRRSSRI